MLTVSRASTSALASSRSRAVSCWPLLNAQCNGVLAVCTITRHVVFIRGCVCANFARTNVWTFCVCVGCSMTGCVGSQDVEDDRRITARHMYITNVIHLHCQYVDGHVHLHCKCVSICTPLLHYKYRMRYNVGCWSGVHYVACWSRKVYKWHFIWALYMSSRIGTLHGRRSSRAACLLQGVVVCCIVMQCAAVCCSVVPHVAVCCSALHCVAERCTSSQQSTCVPMLKRRCTSPTSPALAAARSSFSCACA